MPRFMGQVHGRGWRAFLRIAGVFGLSLALVGMLLFTLGGTDQIAEAAPVQNISARASQGPSTSVDAAPEEAVSTLVSAPAASLAIPWTPPANAYRVTVKDDGLYSMSYDFLQQAGLPVDTLKPATLRMYFMGQEIPIQVLGEEDGQFNTGDQIVFYGRNVDTLFYEGLFASNKYVNELVYFLAYGSGINGLRMATVDGTPAGATPQTVTLAHILNETNYWYFSQYPPQPISGGDHFFGQWIQARRNRVASFNVPFSAANVDNTRAGHLEMTFQGYADGPHYIRLYLNNTQIYSGTDGWKDFGDHAVSIPITPGLFINGSNIIKVDLVNLMERSYDKIYINWTQIDFPRQLVAQGDNLSIRSVPTGTWTFAASGFSSNDVGIYDVSDPFNVRRIINGTGTAASIPNGPQEAAAGITFQAATTPNSQFFLGTPSSRKTPTGIQAVTSKTSAQTPEEILRPTNHYDYIIITHGDFWDQILPLANYRSLLYDVALIDVQTIYDRFGGGMMSAEAIRDFLGYARSNWSGAAPEMVLLVGDGAVDMRNYQFVTPPTFIPPFLVAVDPYLGETASDNRFVMLEGNDILPDMAIGRFPAATPADVTAMVQKTIDYETSPPIGDWNKNVLFVSDDLEGGGGDFYSYSDVLVSGFVDAPTNTIPFLPDPYTSTRAYLGVTCDLTNGSPATECREMISNTLNITGALLVSYVGHASRDSWAIESLLDGQLVSNLNMAGQYPIILAMTCLEGSFHETSVLSLAESYMRSGTGAVASWSPTGLGVANGHDLLEQAFFKHLFQDGITQIGKLTVLAKEHLHAEQDHGRFDDLVDTYVLFGDPALRIQTYLGPTAVEMGDTDGMAVADAAYLSWKTVSEADVLAFNVMRAVVDKTTGTIQGSFQRINDVPIPAQAGGSATGARYTFVDRGVVPGLTYRYSLEVLSTDGTTSRQSLADVSVHTSQIERVYLPSVAR